MPVEVVCQRMKGITLRKLSTTLLLSLSLLLANSGYGQGALTQDPCPGQPATISLFKQVGNDVLENIGFDHLGQMWVSNSSKGSIERYDTAGVLAQSLAIASPGAITRGPDDLLYVNAGSAAAGAPGRTQMAAVYRFDPSIPSPTLGLVASGWNMSNGATFDDSGYLYVSNDFDKQVTRIDIASQTSSTWSDVYGTNGLVFIPSASGGDIYAAITFDQRSPIERIPVSAPQTHTTFAELSLGGASLEPGVRVPTSTNAPLLGVKGLDDMTVVGNDLYVVANGTGELLRVSLADGSACLVASGLHNPSSLRRESGFDGTGDLFVTEFSGAIRRVTNF